MYENGCTNFRGCTRMYEFLVFCFFGGGQRFFWLLRDEAARLVLKLRAGPGPRRATRSAQRREPQVFGPPGKPGAWLVARHSASYKQIRS
jgi:hypothetical protein